MTEENIQRQLGRFLQNDTGISNREANMNSTLGKILHGRDDVVGVGVLKIYFIQQF
jgi:hypothetical protein